MPDEKEKINLNRTVAISALHSIREENKLKATSGDMHVANTARQNYLLSTILLTLLSDYDDDEFNGIEVAGLPTPAELEAATGQEQPVAPAVVAVPAAPAAVQPQTADTLADSQQPDANAPLVPTAVAETPPGAIPGTADEPAPAVIEEGGVAGTAGDDTPAPGSDSHVSEAELAAAGPKPAEPAPVTEPAPAVDAPPAQVAEPSVSAPDLATADNVAGNEPAVAPVTTPVDTTVPGLTNNDQ